MRAAVEQGRVGAAVGVERQRPQLGRGAVLEAREADLHAGGRAAVGGVEHVRRQFSQAASETAANACGTCKSVYTLPANASRTMPQAAPRLQVIRPAPPARAARPAAQRARPQARRSGRRRHHPQDRRFDRHRDRRAPPDARHQARRAEDRRHLPGLAHAGAPGAQPAQPRQARHPRPGPRRARRRAERRRGAPGVRGAAHARDGDDPPGQRRARRRRSSPSCAPISRPSTRRSSAPTSPGRTRLLADFHVAHRRHARQRACSRRCSASWCRARR